MMGRPDYHVSESMPIRWVTPRIGVAKYGENCEGLIGWDGEQLVMSDNALIGLLAQDVAELTKPAPDDSAGEPHTKENP